MLRATKIGRPMPRAEGSDPSGPEAGPVPVMMALPAPPAGTGVTPPSLVPGAEGASSAAAAQAAAPGAGALGRVAVAGRIGGTDPEPRAAAAPADLPIARRASNQRLSMRLTLDGRGGAVGPVAGDEWDVGFEGVDTLARRQQQPQPPSAAGVPATKRMARTPQAG
jgi:hypothetical protein